MHQQEPQPNKEQGSGEVAKLQLPFDPWRLVYSVTRGWLWMLLSAILFGALGFVLAELRFKDKHTVSGKLIRREISGSFRTTSTGEAFKPQGITVETLVSLMYSKSLMAEAAQKMDPPMPYGEIAEHLMIEPERKTDLIRVTFDSKRTPQETLAYLNHYLESTVYMTRDLLQSEARSMKKLLEDKLVELDKEIWQVNESILAFSRKTNLIHAEKEADAYLRDLGTLELRLKTNRAELDTMELKIRHLEEALRKQNPALIELNQARETLRLLQLEYTEKHPRVIQQQAQIVSLEEERKNTKEMDTEALVAQGDTVSNTLYLDLVATKSKNESLAEEMKQLEVYRDKLRNRLKELPNKSLQHNQLQSKLTHLQEARNVLASRQIETEAFADSPIGYYTLVTPPQLSSVDTESSLPKVLIISVAFGIMGTVMTLVWLMAKAFSAKMPVSPGEFQSILRCPVLGTTDSTHLPPTIGNQTWSTLARLLDEQAKPSWTVGCIDFTSEHAATAFLKLIGTSARKNGWDITLASNGQSAQEAGEPPEQSVKHLQLVPLHADSLHAGKAEQQLKQMDAAVFIVKGNAHLKSHLVALRQELQPYQLKQIGIICLEIRPFFLAVETVLRWIQNPKLGGQTTILAASMLAGLSASSLAGSGEQTESPPTAEQSWTSRYTLGPGDEMHIRVYGRDDLMRQFIQVTPDGRLSYLQAQNIKAEGLTIDELREVLDQNLKTYFQSPRVIITPTRFASKKYHLLGSVRDSGSYQLNRPTTLIEAIAGARGFKTGYFDQKTVELADLARCFLVRKGEKMDVDFRKLFHEGDLTQNIGLEPDDYIYIPSSIVNEVYLLGEVMRPGAIGITTDATVMSVITIRNGFSEKAFREKILVIRGSLQEPETFSVDAADILAGKSPDFILQPRDIVYIPEKPWTHPEEILDMAMEAFVQSAVASWTGANVGPFIRRN